jgi:hypothetical protein
MRRLTACLSSLVLLCAVASPAFAQETETKTLASLFHLPYVVMWLVAAAVCYVIFVVGVTVLFQGSSYPPDVARVGWCLGAVCFTVFVIFYLIGHVLAIALPLYVLAVIFILLLLAAILLLATRPRETQ